MDYGFEAVISPRFADIFRNNCTKNGLVPVQVPAEVGAELLARGRGRPDARDHHRRRATARAAPAFGIESPFPLDLATQRSFLEGLDDIGITLRHVDAIDAYETRRPDWLPATAAPPTSGR